MVTQLYEHILNLLNPNAIYLSKLPLQSPQYAIWCKNTKFITHFAEAQWIEQNMFTFLFKQWKRKNPKYFCVYQNKLIFIDLSEFAYF